MSNPKVGETVTISFMGSKPFEAKVIISNTNETKYDGYYHTLNNRR